MNLENLKMQIVVVKFEIIELQKEKQKALLDVNVSVDDYTSMCDRINELYNKLFSLEELECQIINSI